MASLSNYTAEALGLMQGLVTLPFRATAELLGGDNSGAGRFIGESARLSQDLVGLPFEWAKGLITSREPPQ